MSFALRMLVFGWSFELAYVSACWLLFVASEPAEPAWPRRLVLVCGALLILAIGWRLDLEIPVGVGLLGAVAADLYSRVRRVTDPREPGSRVRPKQHESYLR